MDDWECPECHKAYPVPPKWCPCKPYPVADPYTIYFLLEMDIGIDFDDLMLDAGLQSVISVIAGSDNPFQSSLMILETAGWDELLPMDEEKVPEDLFDWAEHYLETKPSRGTPGTTSTGYMLLKENFSPGVETLDYFGWKIVDLGKEEYDKLLDMYTSQA